MIDTKHLCPGCMQNNPTPNKPCPYCGYSSNTPSPEQALPVFSILEGKYLIGCPLGKGGFGISYLAMHLPTETAVAIKEYFPAEFACRASDNETVLPMDEKQKLYFSTGMKSFTKEGQILQQLSDINGIVPFREILYCNSTAYIVMAYVPGLSLKKYMKNQLQPFAEHEALSLMRPILLALQAMHQKGFIHRDISPENLMLRPDRTLTLIDFGAAREFSTNDDENLTVILKRGYAPEEQYHSNRRQGPWTDIYAVCAVLYHMLTGILPQESDARVQNDQLTPISRLPGLSISPAVCHAIEKGLQVDALERYADIKDLMKDLYDGYQQSATTEHKTIENIKNDNHTKPTENNTIISNTANIRNDSADAHMPTETASPDTKHPYSFNLTHKIIAVCIVFGILLIILSICIAVGLIQIPGTNKIQNYSVDTDSSANESTSETFETDIQNFTSESETAFPDTSFTETTSELIYESDSILANPTSKQVSAEKAVAELRHCQDDEGNSWTTEYYATLTDAIQAVQEPYHYISKNNNDAYISDRIYLMENIQEDIVIPQNVQVGLYFNNHILTNVSDHTIINYGELSLDSGTIDNTTPEKASLCNMPGGSAVLTYMDLKRSAENGIYHQASDALNSYYTVDNHGWLTILASSLSNSGSYSSNIHNGCKSDNCSGYHHIRIAGDCSIQGGFYALKNESNGTIQIQGGIFSDSYDSLIYSKGTLVIDNASFYQSLYFLTYAGGTYDIGTKVDIDTDNDILFENE